MTYYDSVSSKKEEKYSKINKLVEIKQKMQERLL